MSVAITATISGDALGGAVVTAAAAIKRRRDVGDCTGGLTCGEAGGQRLVEARREDA